MGEWDAYLDEYLTSKNSCYAAGLANRADCAFYAASPSAGDAGWSYIYAEDQKRKVMVEDGSEKSVMINEAATLRESIERDIKKKGPSKTGLWLGGMKYRVVQRDADFEAGDSKLIVVGAASGGKKGVQIVATDKSVCVGFYDEEKGQMKGDCRNAVVDFAVYMASQGL